VPSELDGIHLEASEQEKLGVAVAVRVRELLELGRSCSVSQACAVKVAQVS
jgi:hypothetical protein